VLNTFRGRRPDLTPAQVAAVLVAGIPVLATLLTAFGVTDLSREHQDSLADALTWGGVLAGLLIGGDATLRTARNVADAKRDSAAMMVGDGSALAPRGVWLDPEADSAEADAPVSDDEEFAADGELEQLEARLAADDPDLLGSDAP
jgi:hypothetical protein